MFNKLYKKITTLFKQGLTPKEMALSIAIGSVIGVLPLFGVSTMIITAIAIYMRLNLPMAVFFTYAVSPLHILLFIPYIHLGESIFNIEHSLLTWEAVKNAFTTDVVKAFQDLGFQIICGVSAWVITGIPLVIGLFYFLRFGIGLVQKNPVAR